MPYEKKPNSRKTQNLLKQIKFLAEKRYFRLLNLITTATSALISIASLSKAVSVSASFLIFKTLFDKVILLWASTPNLFASTSSRVWCGLSVILIGRWFFLLRTRMPYVYATLELGVAIATAYLAAKKAYSTSDPTTSLFAFLGGVYLAVRAYDNYSKAPSPRWDWLRQLFEE